ncbi:MAG: PDR/VanB family oxidoreductase [Aeromicrobium sp.]
MAGTPDRLSLVVTAVSDGAPGVRTVALASPGAGPLPSFAPGSHLVLECGPVSNAYSLTGEPTAPATYEISVLEIADGGGGSSWIHRLAVGDPVTALTPRSAFPPVLAARRHVLVAGGIGITPIVSHLRSAALWGRDVEVLYAHRDGHGAHVDDVRELAGDRARFFTDRASFAKDLEATLADQPVGAHLYTCGPAGFMEHVTTTATELGWPASRIHLERFGMDALDPGDPFEAVLTGSGRTISVPAGTSLLDALEAEGLDIPNLCRQGVCGECRLSVRAGAPMHRDLFLSEAEKAANDTLMACVSRAEGDRLEIDL